MAENSIHNLPYEFEIEGRDGEVQTGANGRVGLTVYPDEITSDRADELAALGYSRGSKMRKRNGIKWPGGRKVQWLYAELDGVRCYVKDIGEEISVVLTKKDLYP